MSTRAHLSIGEVLNLVQEEFPDVTISKIRFLESQGLLDPERTPSGYRKFYDEDIERLRWILVQQRENFLPLKVIKDRLAAGELDGPASGNGAAPPTEHAQPGPASEGAGSSPKPRAVRARKSAPRLQEMELPLTGPADPPGGAAGEVAAKAAGTATGKPSAKATEAPIEAVIDLAAQVAEITSMSLSLDELCSATGLTAAQVAELEGFGILSGRRLGGTSYYDDQSMVTARLAARFMAHGVQARHLRMYKIAAEREAALVEQLALPLLQQRSPDARQRVTELVDDLVELGADLRAVMIRSALRDALG